MVQPAQTQQSDRSGVRLVRTGVHRSGDECGTTVVHALCDATGRLVAEVAVLGTAPEDLAHDADEQRVTARVERLVGWDHAWRVVTLCVTPHQLRALVGGLGTDPALRGRITRQLRDEACDLIEDAEREAHELGQAFDIHTIEEVWWLDDVPATAPADAAAT